MVSVDLGIKQTSRGTDNISQAVVWCMNRFKKDEWELNNHWPAGYSFSFKRPEDATHFALKWA